MSFTGDLKHLPIVDVIQLLHATKKSGTLTVKGRHGECVLVFSAGYIVSGRPAKKGIHLGQVLVDLKVLREEVHDRILQEHAKGGKSLAALLLYGGHVKKEGVVKGLETLIEMAIVDVLTWSGGTFTLEVDRVDLLDGYRDLQQHLQQETVFSTQSILMDALRIYDEKKRDGELADDGGAEEAIPAESTGGGGGWKVSVDDLGLADLDQLEEKIPGVFSSLPDINPFDLHRQKLLEVAPELSTAEQESLLTFLQQLTERIMAETPAPAVGGQVRVVLFSPDELFQYMLTAACKDSGIFIFATDDEQDLVPIIEQSLGKYNGTLLVLDRPNSLAPAFSEENLMRLRHRLKEGHPRLPVIQLAPPSGFAFTLQAFDDSIRTVFPRPLRADGADVFAADFSQFLASFRTHLQGFAQAQGDKGIGRLNRCLAELREAPEMALTILRFVGSLFPRALTLVVAPNGLVGDKAIGMGGGAAESKHSVSIPLVKTSIFSRVIEEGRLFFGPQEDQMLQEHLYPVIGTPRRPSCLLLPLRCRGRTVAVIYADFGEKEIAPVEIDFLEILAGQASILLENALLSKKENSPR
jgi:GAF domain-containing protein